MPVLNFAKALRLGGQHVAAVHLDHHRVFPLPPAFLEPPVGQVTTPDLPADFLGASVRFRTRFRFTTQPTVSALVAMQRNVGASNISWDFYVRYTDMVGIWRVSSSGTALEQSNSVIPAGNIGVGVDVYVGARWENAGGQTVTAGEQSTDGGLSWQQITSGTRTGLFTPFDSTAPITVGGSVSGGAQSLPGRIYWAELTAIQRARLIFPGVIANQLSGPALDLTGVNEVEMVTRAVAADWESTPSDYQVLHGRRSSGNIQLLLRRTSGGPRLLNLVWYDGTNRQATGTAWPVGAIPNGSSAWFRARLTATQVLFDYSTSQSSAEPTAWTNFSTVARPGTALLVAGAGQPFTIGGTAVSDTPFNGRIQRAVLRNLTSGATLYDVRENDAGKMLTATTFAASVGGTITVVQTAPNQIVQPQPDVTIWRFDANEWPRGATTLTDPRGRAWTASNGAALSHPASIPDSEVTA